MRVTYFGTPAFAVPALRALARAPEFEVTLVVTRPDRPAGRGQRLQRSEIANAATDLGLDVFGPESLRSREVRERLAAERADLFVVAAYGQIFGPKILAVPAVASLNLHASILPRFRGASPVAAAIAAGDDVTGVSLMVMGEGLDTGPVISTVTVPISADATTETLTTDLATSAAELAVTDIPRFLTRELVPHPQSGEATLTRPMTKADGWLDWSLPAPELVRRVRAMWPWPRAWTTCDQDETKLAVQIHAASVVDATREGPPGTVVLIDGSPAVITGDGALMLDIVQFPGQSPRSGLAAVSAGRFSDGMTIGRSEDGLSEHQPLFVSVSP